MLAQIWMVDIQHNELVKKGMTSLSQPEDHPWGDRSFQVTDPSGVTVCVFMETEPSEEFRQYFV